MSSSCHPSLPAAFYGKWHRRKYRVTGVLGRGANGTVYLAIREGQRVALKVGGDPVDLLTEAHVLKSLQEPGGPPVGPVLYEVDDVVLPEGTFPFYAMEYVEGEPLEGYVARTGTEWIPVLAVQLLTRLERLHRLGWVFCDLKPENVIVTAADRQARLIDFGGASRAGRSVRQFTEEYDRAAWQAGDRRADPAYDLFALAAVVIRLTVGKEAWRRIPPQSRQVRILCDIIRDSERLHPYRVPLWNALCGKYASAAAMKRDMLAALSSVTRRRSRRRKAGRWIGRLFIASLLVFAGSLYLAWM